MMMSEIKNEFKKKTSYTNIQQYIEDLNELSKELEKCEDYTNWLKDISHELKPVIAYTDGINYYIVNGD